MPEGVKWRGKSVYQVLNRLQDAARTGAALFQIQQAANERIARLKLEAAQILVGLADELKDIDPKSLFFGGWECKGSPTDYCIYDNDEDNWHDHCLFCGEPSDRG